MDERRGGGKREGRKGKRRAEKGNGVEWRRGDEEEGASGGNGCESRGEVERRGEERRGVDTRSEEMGR